MATSERIPPSIRHALAWLLGTAGALVLVVVLARTAVGAVDARLAPWTIALLSALGFGVSMTVWRLDDVDRAAGQWPRRLTGATAGWLAGLLFGLLIAGRDAGGAASVAAIALTWAAAVAVRLSRTSDVLRQWEVSANPFQRASARPTGVTPPATPAPVPVVSEAPNGAGPQPEAFGHDASLRMELRRHTTPDGETIEITARLEFPAGAREAVLHVPFWPALMSPPIVDCEPLEADDVDLRVTTAECYGLRIEGRRPAATAVPYSVLIGVEVRAPSASGVAAAA